MKSSSTVFKVVVPITILSVSVYALNVQRNKLAYPPVYSNGNMNKDIVGLAKMQQPKAVLPPISSLTAWNTYLQGNFLRPANVDHQHMAHMQQDPNHTKERFEFLAQNITSKKIDVPVNATVTYINGRRKIASSEVEEAKAMGVDCEYQHQCAELIWEAYNSYCVY